MDEMRTMEAKSLRREETTDADRKPVDAAVFRLGEAIDEYARMATVLDERLQPILSPHFPTAEGEALKAARDSSPLAGRLEDETRRLRDVTERLGSIVSRLEV
jgi:hypothetical protein